MSSRDNLNNIFLKMMTRQAYCLAVILSMSLFFTQACDSESVNDSTNNADESPMAGEQQAMPIADCIGPEGIIDHGSVQAVTEVTECVTCEGSPAPDFKLRDVNPTSCGINQFYGLDAFQGQVTFVVLLRSTCGYCMAQLEKLEQMRYELLVMGLELYMIVINERGTQEQVDNLTQRAQIPIFQDVEEVMAWEAFSSTDPNDDMSRVGGDKDDMYIYDRQGNLWRFLDDDNPMHKLTLSDEEGYNYLKNILVTAINEAP
ncbi:MAG: hypothetical protein CMH49_06270 [Myxococcales bacterium]|nr:hypothetical protein [Myxococcales bacterium]